MESFRNFRITNELGIHARVAAKIVQLAGLYKSKLFLSRDGKEVDGSSILSILTLDCPKGTKIGVRAVGEDSEEILEKIGALIEDGFGEDHGRG